MGRAGQAAQGRRQKAVPKIIPVESIRGAAAICLAWVLFGLVHSLLSREWAKRRAERLLGPAFLAGLYRPLYAVLSAAMILWLWLFSARLPGDIVFFWLPDFLYIVPFLGKFAGGALIAASFLQISFAEFTGAGPLLRLLRGDLKDLPPTPPDALPMSHGDEPLAAAGVYLWVRHPLNTAAFLWIWAQPAYTLYNLTFAACLTVYILIGNRFEERDLVHRYGPGYERYRLAVPAFFGGLRGLGGRSRKLRAPPG